MLERELDGNVVVSTPKAPVRFSMLINKLFSPASLKYLVDRVYTALRESSMKNVKLTNKNWWETWLRTLDLPEHEDYGPDKVSDLNESPEVQQQKQEEKLLREAKTANFLQVLTNEITTAFPSLKKNARQWTSYFHTHPVATDNDIKMPRKPDIVWLNLHHPVKDWRRKGLRVLCQLLKGLIEEKKRRKSNRQFLNEVAMDVVGVQEVAVERMVLRDECGSGRMEK